jgi:hypothetical protein
MPVEWEAGRVPGPVWTFRRKISFSLLEFHVPTAFNSGEPPLPVEWEGSRTGLDVSEKRYIFPCWNSSHSFSIVQPGSSVTVLTELRRLA